MNVRMFFLLSRVVLEYRFGTCCNHVRCQSLMCFIKSCAFFGGHFWGIRIVLERLVEFSGFKNYAVMVYGTRALNERLVGCLCRRPKQKEEEASDEDASASCCNQRVGHWAAVHQCFAVRECEPYNVRWCDRTVIGLHVRESASHLVVGTIV